MTLHDGYIAQKFHHGLLRSPCCFLSAEVSLEMGGNGTISVYVHRGHCGNYWEIDVGLLNDSPSVLITLQLTVMLKS